MNSSNSMGLETPSTKSFVPLLVEESRHRKNVSRKWSQLQLRLWDKRDWEKAALAALRDTRENWIPTTTRFLIFAWVGTLVWLLHHVVFMSRNLESIISTCPPDGKFDPYDDWYDVWVASGFFQITLAWGTFSFANAKFIDVAWDVVFARGGQALIAWVSWRVVADYVTTSIQVSPITYDSFWAIFLQDQPSFFSTYHLIRDFARSRGLQSRSVMVISISVAIFTLLFPTLGSAMTGYVANNEAFVKGYDGELVPFSEFQLVQYVVHDGWRVNLTGDFLVTFPPLYRCKPCVHDSLNLDPGLTGFLKFKSATSTPLTELPPTAPEPLDVEKYGFYGLEDRESLWMNKRLLAPTLNISAFWIPANNTYFGTAYGWNWTDPRTNAQPFNNATKVTYATGNETYSISHIVANGSCQPLSGSGSGADSPRESYQWGFSYLQLFTDLILLLLWSFGLLYIWFRARLMTRTGDGCDVPRGFKGVLELANGIRRELQEADPDELSRDQLAEEVKKRLKGGSIELEKTGEPPAGSIWQMLTAWLSEKKWWVIAVVLMIIPCIPLALFDKSFGWWLLVPIISIAMAMCIGQSRKSRIFLTLVDSVLGTIIFLGVWYGTYH
ncbi:hypothetical protein CCHL11_04617 [Colletotrichum chlorophyti]|uniref:Uncharacterized protein n=1 Tax=Colletotrichum chlorophyti TaxID=708187 RepID=A0A1Q8RRD5_9PEZI|nr:hypothetical protein CCHL11_04617 [Colletotrichum chlorophyti]